jgi:hypothetical protein
LVKEGFGNHLCAQNRKTPFDYIRSFSKIPKLFSNEEIKGLFPRSGVQELAVQWHVRALPIAPSRTEIWMFAPVTHTKQRDDENATRAGIFQSPPRRAFEPSSNGLSINRH